MTRMNHHGVRHEVCTHDWPFPSSCVSGPQRSSPPRRLPSRRPLRTPIQLDSNGTSNALVAAGAPGAICSSVTELIPCSSRPE